MEDEGSGGTGGLEADHEVEPEELLVPQLAPQEEHQVPELISYLVDGKVVENGKGFFLVMGEEKATL